MSRKRQDATAVRISDEEYTRLENKFEVLRNEFTACKRKLDSKCEALLILSQDLDQCRSERDQFKLMAEQLRERYQSMKKSLSGKPMQSSSDSSIHQQMTAAQSQNISRLLCEARENSKSLQFEVDDLKQKLHDSQGDVKLLREQIARQRVGSTDEGINMRHFPAHEREDLVQKLEASHEQYSQLERDLQTVLDEKEEQVTERDVYKTKYERLNQELNYILKGDENRVVDIDALVMENKYLKERLHQMEEEKSMAMAAVSKYKSLLERKKPRSALKFGQSKGGGMIISQKQVQEVLESKQTTIPTVKAMTDLQALAGALLDSVNDKNLALSHQRKTNKILASRVAELEKKIKTLEVAGLWSTTGDGSLEKLQQECDQMQDSGARQRKLSTGTDSDRLSTSEGERDSELEPVTPLDSNVTSPMTSPTHAQNSTLSHLELSDLDLLPTKEVPSRDATGQKPHPARGIDMLGLVSSQETNNSITTFSQSGEGTTHLDQSASCFYMAASVEHGNHDNRDSTDVVDKVNDDDKYHVYSDDKCDQEIDDDPINHQSCNDDDKEDENSECDLALGADSPLIKGIPVPKDKKLEEFYGTETEEDSQNVGLLLESVAKKMCSISHSAESRDTDIIEVAEKLKKDLVKNRRDHSAADDDDCNDEDDDVNVDGICKKDMEGQSLLCSGDGQALLSQGRGASVEGEGDIQRDVEC